MEKTPNYNLKKPSQDDFYNIDDQNENADILDREIKRVADKVDNLPKLPEDIARETTPKSIETKVTENNTKLTTIDGKIDTVDTVVDRLENDMNTIQNEITSSSTSYLGGQVQSIYNKLNSGGMGIKSVQFGYERIPNDWHKSVIVSHNYVNVNKSFILITYMSGHDARPPGAYIYEKNATSFSVSTRYVGKSGGFSWQLVEFY